MNYLEINKKSSNAKVAAHLASEFYDLENFKKGKSSLKTIELELLGNVENKEILHLQCHFGQDSLSLARMGAKVTGLDLSDKAIEAAQDLNSELRLDARFVCCDVYQAAQTLKKEYDIVFTTYGTIGWLPDLNEWARNIVNCLKPGGELIFCEFHPNVWMFDDNFEKVAYSYFNIGPIRETEQGTYADRAANLELSYEMWNHPFQDVFSALIKSGLKIISFQEYNYSPYNCFKGTLKINEDRYIIEKFGERFPMVYSIKAIK